MTKKEMKEYLMKEYAKHHDTMMWYANSKASEKMYIENYGRRQAIGTALVEMGFMTENELQKYLNTLNKKYD